jgi:hypothetical protein
MPETNADDSQQATPTPGTSAGAKAPTIEELAADRDHWRQESRKHEERARSRANAERELEALRKASMSDQEKAVAEARAQARAEALREAGAGRAEDAIRAAFAGHVIDVDALLTGIDTTRFLTADNEPDRQAIAKWAGQLAPPRDEQQPAFPDLGQGTRSSSSFPLNGDPLERALKSKLGVR